MKICLPCGAHESLQSQKIVMWLFLKDGYIRTEPLTHTCLQDTQIQRLTSSLPIYGFTLHNKMSAEAHWTAHPWKFRKHLGKWISLNFRDAWRSVMCERFRKESWIHQLKTYKKENGKWSQHLALDPLRALFVIFTILLHTRYFHLYFCICSSEKCNVPCSRLHSSWAVESEFKSRTTWL